MTEGSSEVVGSSSTPWLSTEDDLLMSIGENFTTETPFFYNADENVFFFKTPEDMLNPAKRNPAFYPIIITHAITFILGIVGNVVAVSVMIGDRKGRNATNLFLVSLAAADLLLLLFCIPLEVVQYFLVFEDNGVICKTARYTELLSASASILNLCAVSLERFIVIVFPMRSRSVCTQSNCRKALCVVWIFAIVLSLPVMLTKEGYSVTYTNNVTSVSVYYCEEESVTEGLPIAIYKFVILFAAPAILMIICYFHVIRELWRSTRNIQLLTNSKSIRASSNVHSGERKPLNNAKYSPSPVDNNKGNLGIPGTAGGSENNKAPSPSSLSRRSSQQKNISITHHHHGSSAASAASSPGLGCDDESRRITTTSSGNTASAACAKYLNHNGHHHPNHNNLNQSKDLLKPNITSGYGLQQQQHRRALNQSKPHKADDAKRARKQVIKMLILIILLFLVCWGPKLLLNIVLKLSLIFGYPIYSPEVYLCRVIFSLIPFVHSCINPIVYSFMSKNFRRSMNRQLGRCCGACGCKCRNNCGAHRNSIPLRSTARARTTSQAIESTYCQISDMASTRHTEIEGISAI